MLLFSILVKLKPFKGIFSKRFVQIFTLSYFSPMFPLNFLLPIKAQDLNSNSYPSQSQAPDKKIGGKIDNVEIWINLFKNNLPLHILYFEAYRKPVNLQDFSKWN